MLNRGRALRKFPCMWRPGVLLSRSTLPCIDRCIESNGCVDDHGRSNRHVAFDQRNQRSGTAGGESEQADSIFLTEAVLLSQRSHNRLQLARCPEYYRLEY